MTFGVGFRRVRSIQVNILVFNLFPDVVLSVLLIRQARIKGGMGWGGSLRTKAIVLWKEME